MARKALKISEAAAQYGTDVRTWHGCMECMAKIGAREKLGECQRVGSGTPTACVLRTCVTTWQSTSCLTIWPSDSPIATAAILRIVRLAAVRLGDAGQQALIEFVGERDRVKSKKTISSSGRSL
jgi:hypothetical protein